MPVVTDERLGGLVGTVKIEKARRYVGVLEAFLNREAISDVFESHYPDRAEWRKWMFDQYGDVFHKGHWINNLLARNDVTAIKGNIDLMAMLLRGNEQAEAVGRLLVVRDRLVKAVGLTGGYSYDDLAPGQKVKVAKFKNRRVIEALGVIAGEGAVQKEIPVVAELGLEPRIVTSKG